MKRRDFLSLLGIGLAGVTIGAELDLDRLLWIPKPIISVPDMAAVDAVAEDWVTREALLLLNNNLTVARFRMTSL